jgi:Tol biopolymer transport system component
LNGRIVLSVVEESSTIWKLKVDPSGHAVDKPVPLTTGSAVSIQPALSKDGKTLAFASRQSGLWELQTMDLATGALNHLGPRLPFLATPVFNGPGDRIDYIGQAPDSKSRSNYEEQVKGGVPEKLFDNAAGGIWDSSPSGHWLLIHTTYPIASPRAGYTDAEPFGSSVSVTDRLSLHTTAFLSDPAGDLYQAHFSHDGRWVTFNRLDNQHSQIYIAPFSTQPVPTTNWIRVSSGTWDDKPRFSWDDRLIFFVSDRDGYRCIWAQRLTADMHPEGDPFPVFHSHSLKRSIGNLPMGNLELAVGPGILVFNQAESRGDLWLLDPK